MATDTQRYATAQYRLPLFGYITTCGILLIACRIFMGDAAAVLNLAVQRNVHQYAQASPPETLHRSSPIYWITGEGVWGTKWEYTQHDSWLAIASILANLWMGWEYYRYAASCGVMSYQLPPGLQRTHMLQLRRVFLQCVIIHAGMSVVLWWLPAYWLLTAMIAINAMQTRRLNSTKMQILCLDAATSVASAETVAATTAITQQTAVHSRLDQARDILMQRVPYADE